MFLRSVVLVGNGFDISVGLETYARAFIEDFVQDTARGDNRYAKELANRISTDGIDTWADFEQMMGCYSEQFDLSSSEDYLRQKEALDDYLGEWLTKKSELITDSFIGANAGSCLNSLAGFRRGLPEGQRNLIEQMMKSHSMENYATDIICFNYTDALWKMYQNRGGEGTKLGLFGSNRHSVLANSFLRMGLWGSEK